MNSVFSAPPGLAAIAPAAQVMPTADLARLAADIRNMAAGSLLTGLIVGHDRAGTTFVKLGGGGVVAVRIPDVLPQGTSITVELQTRSGQTQAVLLSSRPPVDTRADPGVPEFDIRGAPQPPPAALPEQAAKAPLATGAPTPPGATSLAASPPLVATVITQPGAAEQQRAAQSPEAMQLMPGTQIKLRLVQVPAKAATTSGLPWAEPGSRPTGDQPAPASPLQPRGIAPRSSPLPNTSGQTQEGTSSIELADIERTPDRPQAAASPAAPSMAPARLRDTPAAPPMIALPELSRADQPAGSPAAPAIGPQQSRVPAVVIGATPSGQIIVETSLGRLALALPAGLGMIAAGDRLTFALESALPLQPTEGPKVPTAAAPQRWQDLPALHAVHAHMSTAVTSPERRNAFLEMLPKPGAKLAGQLFSFLSAATRGDGAAAVGQDAVDELNGSGGRGLLGTLDREFKDVAREAERPGDWQMWPVPFLHFDGLGTIRCYSRRRNGDESKRTARDRRFVVECDLSVLGLIQVDGLMHSPDATLPHLDVVVRSQADLPAAMRREMQSLFLDACEDSRLTGRMAFQTAPIIPIIETNAARPVGRGAPLIV